VIYFTAQLVSSLCAVELQEDELDWILRKATVAYSKYYPDICLKGLRQKAKFLRQNKRSSCRDSNRRSNDLEHHCNTSLFGANSEVQDALFWIHFLLWGRTVGPVSLQSSSNIRKLFSCFRPYGTKSHLYESYNLRIKRNQHELWNKGWRLLWDKL
jgi:hypothetical protein